MEASIDYQNTVQLSLEQRKKLLPKWIKFFGWLFIIMGALVPFLYIASAIFGFSASYSMFGLSYEGGALSLMPLLISIVIFINGLCAFGLLFSKDWGLTACLVYGYIGLFITIFTMLISPELVIHFEPLIQIPYLIKLHKLRSEW
jgi:hypothetical protein